MNLKSKYRAFRAGVSAVNRIAVALAVLASTLGSVSLASAYWSSAGSAFAVARTATLAVPVNVVAPSSGTSPIQVGWTRGSGGVDPEGYYVTRRDGSSTAAACGSAPTSLIRGATCVDDAQPGRSFRYVVTAVFKSWTAESEPSTDVTVLAPLAVTTSTLPEAMVGAGYSVSLAGSGGAAPYTWSLTGLPAGLTLNPGTGVISGVPTTTGTFTVTVRIADAGGRTDTRVLALAVVDALSIRTTSLPGAIVNQLYTLSMAASGGTAPYRWTATGLPVGMHLAADGTLSGAPGAAGTSSVSVTVTDARSRTHVQALTLLVEGPVALASGGSFNCALLASGAVKCWGLNHYGQLGDGTTTNRNTPVQVTGLTSGVTAITAIWNARACALLASGAVKCWGLNSYGQLGDGTTTNSSTPVQVKGLGSGATAITNGTEFGCAVVASSVRCWGRNNVGQLGNGTTTDSATPVQVLGLAGDITALTAGSAHTCAVVSGAARCWGYNFYGQLGDGTRTDRNTAVAVTGLTTGVTAFARGNNHTCALASGGVRCWGYNFYGQLGNGGTSDTTLPVQVDGLTSGVTAVTGGTEHNCAVVDGSASCWGYNSLGQLGDGSTLDRSTPVQVSGLTSKVTEIIGGSDHSCALVAGTVECWGIGGAGQLGAGTTTDSTTPVHVIGLVVDIATTTLSDGMVGEGYRLTLESSGGRGPYTWAATGLPDGVTLDATTGVLSGTPTAAGTSTVTVTVTDAYGETDTSALALKIAPELLIRTSTLPAAIGDEPYTVTLTGSGGATPYSWSALGLPTGMTLDTATGVISGSPTETGASSVSITVTDARGRSATSSFSLAVDGAVTVVTGQYHSCALLASGSVKCWGSNSSGQLGDGSYTDSTHPVQVRRLLDGVTALSAWNVHTCAVLRTGAVKCWGSNSYGELGDGTDVSDSNVPVTVSGLTGEATGVTAGVYHSCALVEGSVECWGHGGYGQLGDGTTANSSVAVPVTGLSGGVTAVTAGAYHTCAVDAGSARCWGNNASGQLGDGTTANSNVPVQVAGLTSGVTRVSTGGSHACAVVSGSATCWGLNTYGQLGNGTTIDSRSPVPVTGLNAGVTAMIGRGSQTCALVSGAAKCWGANDHGQLGDGTTTASSVPVQVFGLTSGVTAIGISNLHGCAVVSRSIRCWGDNTYGELGDGSTTSSPAPVHIPGLVVGVLTSSLPAGMVGEPYNFTLTGTGNSTPYAWAAGTLPPGLTLDSCTGEISGSPTAAGTFTVSITITDAEGRTSSQDLPLTIVPALAITTANLPPAVAHDAYGVTLNGAGDRPPFVWSATGLPSGLSLNPTTGLISGTATAVSSQQVDVTITDALGTTRTKTYTLAVGPAVLVSTEGVPAAMVGEAYATSLTAEGGTPPYRWSASGLPAGLTMDSNGVLLGTPTAAGALTPSFTATDAHGKTNTAVLPINVDPTLAITTTALPGGVASQPYSLTLGVSGGAGPYSWAATGLPAGISLHPTTGALSGTVTETGTSEVAVTVTDARGRTRTSAFDLTVAGAVAISTSNSSTCALLSSGSVKCWGDNTYGDVGDGTTTNRNAPTQVTGLTSGVTAITSWGSHHCALVSGAVKCWGENTYGQLGDGTTTHRSTPVQVVGLTSGVTAITTGYNHACALLASGAVKCWGDNTYRQLGNGTTTSSSVPVQVSGLTSGVTIIGSGASSSCAVLAGSVRCWGDNTGGQLGDGTTNQSTTPVQVVGISGGVTSLGGGAGHSCAVVSGAVRCWGSNANGQLGDGTTTSSATPVQVVGLTSGATTVLGRGSQSCAIVSGAARCWGANTSGQLGDGTTTESHTPVQVVGMSDRVTGIATSNIHACAVASGAVKCWGDNTYGEIGDGTNTARPAPVPILGLVP